MSQQSRLTRRRLTAAALCLLTYLLYTTNHLPWRPDTPIIQWFKADCYAYAILGLGAPLVAAVFLVFACHSALLAARERKDRRRGLCPTCGYDLRATPTRCTECGTPVTTNKSETAA